MLVPLSVMLTMYKRVGLSRQVEAMAKMKAAYGSLVRCRLLGRMDCILIIILKHILENYLWIIEFVVQCLFVNVV